MNNECNNKTCPWKGGNSLAGKPRRLFHNPDVILGDYIIPGMWVLDVGCGMGYMAAAAAQAVGAAGKVILVDIQPEMLAGAMKRMQKVGFEGRAFFIQCKQKSLCLENFDSTIDFAYAFMMVHEVNDKMQLLSDLYVTLKPGGRLLVSEPYVHVSRSNFRETLACAKALGYEASPPSRRIKLCRTIILRKPERV